MDSMEVNKGIAAVLTAGIVFMVGGLIGEALVETERPKETAIKIEVAAPAPAPGAPAVAAAPQQPIGPMLAKADPSVGEADTKKLCVTCHSFDQGGAAKVGPNLYGVVGAPHGHMAGFSYSDAMKGKGGQPWTYDELNEWLTKPSAYMPGTKMAFAGIGSEKDRADVIAYLRSLSPNPEPLPK